MNNILRLGKDCCGCTACEQICPKNCIHFSSDSEGFDYPVVDETLCVDCGACVKHCPVLSDVSMGKNPEIYAAKFNDRETTFNSTSGGIFVPLAKKVLDKGGVVFGCAYDENLTARHIAVESEDELFKLQGSKYVQSDLSGIYTLVRKELKNDRFVLFSGTGCQVAGLKAFLGRDYERLLTVDIVCHGVPSPKLFEKYLEYLSLQLGEKVTYYNFRSKEKPRWNKYYVAKTENKKVADSGFFDPYYNAFIKGRTFRESCYKCKFATSNRTGDITLADFWGIETIAPSFYDKNGVSLVLINSQKGKVLWNSLSDKISVVNSTVEQAVRMNHNLANPTPRPQCRDTIYNGYDTDINQYFSVKLKSDTKFFKKIKALFPAYLKGKLKYYLKKG